MIPSHLKEFGPLRWACVAFCLVPGFATLTAFGQSTAVPFAGVAGPQKANDEGRTELPMVVRKSVSFREIGPAISGGRVTCGCGRRREQRSVLCGRGGWRDFSHG